MYVESNGKKSRVRLARTGEAVGVVVNYLHPDDRYYGFSGHCLCSPSLVRHPDGFLLSSMDVFEHDGGQCLTLIFRSDDDGQTWHYVSELYPAFWGKMFIHKGELYMTACSTEYADLLIGKSTDGGKTWTYSSFQRGSIARANERSESLVKRRKSRGKASSGGRKAANAVVKSAAHSLRKCVTLHHCPQQLQTISRKCSRLLYTPTIHATSATSNAIETR